MKAIQVFGPKHMRMVDVPEPQRESGQLLIRSEVLSICGSDMRSFRFAFPEEQYPLAPCMPCHECVGVVEESDSAEVPAGTRVIALNIGRGGRGGNYGMGAQYVLSAPDLVIPLPEGADPFTYMMCQPVGTVLYAAKRLPNVIGQSVVVLGQGVIGLTFTRLAVQMGGEGHRRRPPRLPAGEVAVAGRDAHDQLVQRGPDRGGARADGRRGRGRGHRGRRADRDCRDDQGAGEDVWHHFPVRAA